MKKLLLLIPLMIISGSYIQAQSYDNYIQKAFELLDKGNVDAAKRAYEVYKQMSNQSNSTFEELFDKTKKSLSWMNFCHIVRLNDTISIAIQKIDPKQLPVKYEDAATIARDSKLFGFTDWSLPTQSEMRSIIQNSPIDLLVYTDYWTASYDYMKYNSALGGLYYEETKYWKISKNGELVITYKKIKDKREVPSEVHEFGDMESKCNYIIVRIFRNGDPNSSLL